MKKIAILTTVAIILCQISVIRAADPIFFYPLYNGDKTDQQGNNGDLIDTEPFTYDFTDRHGQNTAIKFTSNRTKIRIPHEIISNLTGDFFIACWAYVETGNGYESFFSFHSNSSTILDLDTDSDSSYYDYETRVEGNGHDFGKLTSQYYDTWSHWGLEYNSQTNQFTGYINGQPFGTPLNSSIDLSLIDMNGYLGSNSGRDTMEGGSLAEFVLYDTLYRPEYYTYGPIQNSIEDLNNNCPQNTIQWNIGSDTSKRVCIHEACGQNLQSIISYVKNNLTISTNTSGVTWEGNVDLDYSLSYNDCGSSNTNECFSNACFEHTILLADDSDYNLTSLPASVDILKPSEPGFSFSDYHNSTSCTHATNSSTCYFIMPIFFKGITTNTTFSRDISLIELEFAVQYSKVPGEDTITADLTNQQFSTVSHESSDVEANIENVAQALSGATLDFDGTPPTSITVGDSIDLELLAPAGNQERDYKNGTFEVELVFNSNGTEVVIPVSPSATTYVNQGNSTGGAIRTVQFTIEANYLGTYTVRAGATLESSFRRLLQEVETESSNLKTELQITVTNPDQTYSYSEFMLIPIAVLGLIAQYYIIKRKQLSKKQQQISQYQKVDIKTQA